MTNIELKERGLNNEEIKYLKLWVKMGYGIDVELYLKYKTLGVKEVKRIKEGASNGWVLVFFMMVVGIGIQRLFLGIGELDPFKTKIACVVGIIGVIYYLNEYIQHKKAIKFIEKNVKTEWQR